MLLQAKDAAITRTEHLRGGEGIVEKHDYIPAVYPPNGKMFAKIVLEPGCSIGRHAHSGDSELYILGSGTLELDDNGTLREMHAGDMSICYDGESHAVKNIGNVTAVMYAVIIDGTREG